MSAFGGKADVSRRSLVTLICLNEGLAARRWWRSVLSLWIDWTHKPDGIPVWVFDDRITGAPKCILGCRLKTVVSGDYYFK
jgi:hypothetical protein